MLSKTIKAIVLAGYVIGLAGCSSNRDATFNGVYRAASAGDLTELNELVKEGKSLDMVNDDRVTPLCAAYLSDNQTAIDTLKAAGATLGGNCVVLKDKTLVRYEPDYNPPQIHYPTPMNNSVITTTILTVTGIAGIIWLISVL